MNKNGRYVVVLNKEKISELPLIEFLESESECEGIKYSQTIKQALKHYKKFKEANKSLSIDSSSNLSLNQDNTIQSQQAPKTDASFNKSTDNQDNGSSNKDKPLLGGFRALSNKDIL